MTRQQRRAAEREAAADRKIAERFVRRVEIEGNFVLPVIELGNENYGRLLRGMHSLNVPKDIFRRALRVIWIGMHGQLICHTSREEVFDLFRYAEFPIPDDLPEQVELWRGMGWTDGERPASGTRVNVPGYSWSRSRDAACYFALRIGERKIAGVPILVHATVPRERVLFSHTKQGYDEILHDAEAAGYVDGAGEDDWLAAAAREHARYKADSDAIHDGKDAQEEGIKLEAFRAKHGHFPRHAKSLRMRPSGLARAIWNTSA